MYSLFVLLILLNFSLVLFFNRYINYFTIRDLADGKRKIHEGDIPIIGGTLFYINFLIVTFYDIFYTNVDFFLTRNDLTLQLNLLISYSAIFMLGLYDDKYNLSANKKFLIFALILAGSFLIDKELIINNLEFSFSTYSFHLREFSFIFTLLCFLLFINAFNMFDGINLQSISYSIIIFLYLIFIGNSYSLSTLFIIILIFLFYLNYSNKLFMGDSGTLPLSFLISYLIVKNYNNGDSLYVDNIFLLLMIPGLDLVRLSFTRILNGKNPFHGDRNHIHHLLNLKFSQNLSIILLNLIIIIPLILAEMFLTYIASIIISLIIYTFVISVLKK